jgi:predicted dienelactone hydrolase
VWQPVPVDFLSTLAIGAALLAGTRAAWAQPATGASVSATPFARPTGAYPVGTRDTFWLDTTRSEPFTKDPNDHRHILVQVWYPASPRADAEPALYIRTPSEFRDSTRAFARIRHVRTNAVLNAPVAGKDEPYPVIVYHAGGGWVRFGSTFTAETLASQGYIVVGVDHTGFSMSANFPDGYRFEADTLRPPASAGKLREDTIAFWDYLHGTVFDTWRADATFVVDQLEKLNREPGQPFYRRLDLDRVGAVGWSFGGAAAIQMTRDDRRVKAAVDQDGQLFGDVRDKGTSRPVMLIHHGGDPPYKSADTLAAYRELVAMVDGWDRTMLERSTNDWYEVWIANTQHVNFSDSPLFASRTPPGALDPRRAHEIINAYTLAFFDRYLRGRASDLLKGPSTRYAEATFKTKQ